MGKFFMLHNKLYGHIKPPVFPHHTIVYGKKTSRIVSLPSHKEKMSDTLIETRQLEKMSDTLIETRQLEKPAKVDSFKGIIFETDEEPLARDIIRRAPDIFANNNIRVLKEFWRIPECYDYLYKTQCKIDTVSSMSNDRIKSLTFPPPQDDMWYGSGYLGSPGHLATNLSNFFAFEFGNDTYILENPKVRVDSKNRLHSVTDAAIEFEDVKIYYIHGVRFGITIPSNSDIVKTFCEVNNLGASDRERLLVRPFAALDAMLSNVHGFEYGMVPSNKEWLGVVKRKLSIKKILQIGNIEKRRIALEYYGPEMLFKGVRPKLLDTSPRGNKLWIFRMRRGIWNTPREQTFMFLEYGCPSTKRKYISFVEPRFTKADEAMAWKHNMTENEYSELNIES